MIYQKFSIIQSIVIYKCYRYNFHNERTKIAGFLLPMVNWYQLLWQSCSSHICLTRESKLIFLTWTKYSLLLRQTQCNDTYRLSWVASKIIKAPFPLEKKILSTVTGTDWASVVIMWSEIVFKSITEFCNWNRVPKT